MSIGNLLLAADTKINAMYFANVIIVKLIALNLEKPSLVVNFNKTHLYDIVAVSYINSK